MSEQPMTVMQPVEAAEVRRLREEYNWLLNLASDDPSGSVQDFWKRLRQFIRRGSKGDPAAIRAWVDKELPKIERFAGLTGDQIDAAIEEAQPDLAADVARERDKIRLDIQDQARTLGVELPEDVLASLVEEGRRNGWDRQDITAALRPRVQELLQKNQANEGLGGTLGKTAADLANWSRLNGIEIDQATADRMLSSVAFGEMTYDQVKATLRKQYMVGAFPGWREQIEAGLDVYDLSAPYRSVAQRMLGESNLTLMDNRLKAMMQVQNADGTMGIRPIYEAEKYIRSLPEWQYTDDAYATYTNAGIELGRMFGFR